jgi:transcription elongation factor Elf1
MALEDGDDDPGLVALYNKDQALLYRGGGRFDCPDCGAKNAISAEMKRRGYHCDRCTRAAETGVDE